MNLNEEIRKCGIVPVIALDHVDQAVPLAKALLAGGINFAEITFRTPAAAGSIEKIAKEVPEMIVGAGTVITKEQAQLAVKNGAKFLVSPGMDVEIIELAKELGVLMLPGAVTPTEVITGIKAGIKIFKFFPASNYGGLTTIKSLAAPFGDITFLPTGGINLSNMADYLAFNKIEAVGGSFMCTPELIQANDMDKVTELSKEATDLVKKIRG